MKPEDLADTIYVVRTVPEEDSVALGLRKNQNCMILGLEISKTDAQKTEEFIRDYVRFLIGKAIEIDRESRRQAEDPTTVPPR